MTASAVRRPRTVLLLHGSSGGYGADRQLQLLATCLDGARYRPLVVLPEHGPLAARLEDAGTEVTIAPLAVLQQAFTEETHETARLMGYSELPNAFFLIASPERPASA